MNYQDTPDIRFSHNGKTNTLDSEHRWCQPYQSNHSPGQTEWAVMLKHGLTNRERDFGLKERLVASSLSELGHKMELQDEIYKKFRQAGAVPAWSHKNT